MYPPTPLLLSNAKNAEINTILSASLRSTIHLRGRPDNSPTACHIFFPWASSLEESDSCPLRQLPLPLQGQQQLAHTNHGLTYTSEGPFHNLTQSELSPAIPEAMPGLLTLPGHYTWKLSDTGLLLITDNGGQRTEARRTLKQLYHSGAWLPLKLPMGFQEQTEPPDKDPAADGHV